MDIRAVIFDVNGTLVDVETNEHLDEIYRVVAHFLAYQGVSTTPGEVRDQYFRLLEEHRTSSKEAHPEVDVTAAWAELLKRMAGDHTRGLAPAKFEQLPLFLAELHRAASRVRLQLFPDVRKVLDQLKNKYRLAAVTDAMTPYAVPELRYLGIRDYFDPIIVSGDHGYRKPDPRLFRLALEGVQAPPEQAVFVGDDLERDVAGARRAGMNTVLFCSGSRRVDPFATPADYVIYHFGEVLQALEHLARR